MARNSGDDQDGKIGFPGGNVYKTTDGGNSWSKSGTGLPDGRPVIVIDPTSPAANRTLFALSYGNGVYKSSDGGNIACVRKDDVVVIVPFLAGTRLGTSCKRINTTGTTSTSILVLM